MIWSDAQPINEVLLLRCIVHNQLIIEWNSFFAECWAGSKLSLSTASAAYGTTCNMQCAGNGNQFCGAPNWNSLYAFTPQNPSYTYKGCYTDVSSRTLPSSLFGGVDSGTTIQSCAIVAISNGLTVFGLQDSNRKMMIF